MSETPDPDAKNDMLGMDSPQTEERPIQIEDKVKPPNVYLNDEKEYTPETVMANLNQVRQTLADYQMHLPDTVAKSVENNIKPMVKGMLSSTYHRQCVDDI